MKKILQAAIVAMLNDRVDTIERDGAIITDSIEGFLGASDIEDYINLNSDIKFNDGLYRKIRFTSNC